MSAQVVMFRGRPACTCLAEWLPVYEALLLLRKVIRFNLDIYQLIGGAPQSGGTHISGGAADTGQTSDEAIFLARQMGADACWHRPFNWDGRGGMSHTHLVLRGCPHNGPARYQVDAVDAGFNGLGTGGRGGPDTGPRPLSHRTWREGIAWAKKKLEPEPAVATFQHVTNNIRHALEGPELRSTLVRLAASGADIIDLQEMSGRRSAVEAVKGFASYMADLPDVTGEAGCATLWRASEFELLRGRVFGVGDGGPVPDRAAGPSHRGPEFYTITSLRHIKTQRVIHNVNMHNPPTLGLPEMKAIAVEVGKDIDERLAKFKGQVIVAGDMNTQRPLALLDPDGNSGLVDTSAELGPLVTHGPTKRDIDRVLYRGAALDAVSQRLIHGLPSDHIPRLTRFNLTAKES